MFQVSLDDFVILESEEVVKDVVIGYIRGIQELNEEVFIIVVGWGFDGFLGKEREQKCFLDLVIFQFICFSFISWIKNLFKNFFWVQFFSLILGFLFKGFYY